MEMDLSFVYIAVIFGLGFIGSFITGMLGVGGSIIKSLCFYTFHH